MIRAAGRCLPAGPQPLSDRMSDMDGQEFLPELLLLMRGYLTALDDVGLALLGTGRSLRPWEMQERLDALRREAEQRCGEALGAAAEARR